MADQLEFQKDLAREHIASAWPAIKQQTSSLPGYEEIDRIVICGCGDSHHASLSLAMGFSRLAGVWCHPSNSMNAARYLIPQFVDSANETLIIGISASGEVARTIEAIQVAKHVGARTLAFTGSAEGTLAQTAENSLVYAGPDLPHGPGLISYLSSLLMGYALIHTLSGDTGKQGLDQAMSKLLAEMDAWLNERWDAGQRFATQAGDGLCVFLGSGPAFGSALFAAAKQLEASGEHAWGQDVEEWAHLEYFDAFKPMRTWLLSGDGRSRSREQEVRHAAHAIGRQWHEDRWDMLSEEHGEMNEILAPLVLWAGPSAYASRRTSIVNETPFRNFGGGRDRKEGGGASKIRSSRRVTSFDAWLS